MTRKYHTHTMQTNPRHHEGKPQNTNSNGTSGRQLKQSNQLSISHQDDYETRRTNKTEPNTEPPSHKQWEQQ